MGVAEKDAQITDSCYQQSYWSLPSNKLPLPYMEGDVNVSTTWWLWRRGWLKMAEASEVLTDDDPEDPSNSITYPLHVGYCGGQCRSLKISLYKFHFNSLRNATRSMIQWMKSKWIVSCSIVNTVPTQTGAMNGWKYIYQTITHCL